MGKYTKLRGKVPAFETTVTEPGLKAWYAKVDAWKLEFLGTENGENANSIKLAKEFADREKKKDELEAEIKNLNIEIEGVSQLGVDALQNEGIEKVNLTGGGYIRIDDKLYPQITDKAGAINWLLENKMQEIAEISFSGLDAKQFKALIAWAAKQNIEAGISVGANTLKALVGGILLKGKSTPAWANPGMKTKLCVVGAGSADAE